MARIKRFNPTSRDEAGCCAGGCAQGGRGGCGAAVGAPQRRARRGTGAVRRAGVADGRGRGGGVRRGDCCQAQGGGCWWCLPQQAAVDAAAGRSAAAPVVAAAAGSWAYAAGAGPWSYQPRPTSLSLLKLSWGRPARGPFGRCFCRSVAPPDLAHGANRARGVVGHGRRVSCIDTAVVSTATQRQITVFTCATKYCNRSTAVLKNLVVPRNRIALPVSPSALPVSSCSHPHPTPCLRQPRAQQQRLDHHFFLAISLCISLCSAASRL